MDHQSALEHENIQSTENLVAGIQDTEENEDQETIMLKIDTGTENIVVPQETEGLSGETISFVDEHLNREVQNVNTTDLTGFENTQVVLHTLGGAVEQNAENTADSAVTGTFVADATTLQNLIATGAVQITDAAGQPLQLVTLNTDQASLVPNVMDSTIPANSLTTTIQPLDAVSSVQTNLIDPGETSEAENSLIAQLRGGNTNLDIDQITRLSLLTGPPPIQDLPPGTPQWATRLRDCQKIGDFYRGWLASEVELDHVMTLHKQQTGTMWGTRQSPCPSKPATRLMWRSQYVPFDGMPFLNAGSRAIVMECQYGPRRKGSQASRKDDMAPLKSDFKQTCPARIYIKKVKKFLEYQITVDNDKKTTKAAMDKAFTALKEKNYEGIVQERYYVQLPTETAHEFHSPQGTPVDGIQTIEKPQIGAGDVPSRLHPYVSDKIRELVSKGETRLYVIRKQLRKYVEKELFEHKSYDAPDRHNLHYYPTVNDLQNHIHQAVKDIESGVLGLSADAVNIELVGDTTQLQGAIWQQLQARQQQTDQSAHAESVTVTLTQEPGEGGHLVQKVETNLSDGSKQVSEKLTPETARLLSKLHPQFFSVLNQSQATLPVQIPPQSSSNQVTAAESLIAASSNDTAADPMSGATITVNIPHITEAVGSSNSTDTVLTLPQQDSSRQYTMIQTESGELIFAKTIPNTSTDPSAAAAAAAITTNISQGLYTVDTSDTSVISDALTSNIDTDNVVLQVDTGGVVNATDDNGLAIQFEIANNEVQQHVNNSAQPCIDNVSCGEDESSSKRIKLCLNETGDEEELHQHHAADLSDGNALSISVDHVEADGEAQRLVTLGNMCNIKSELEFSIIKNEDVS